VDEVAFGRYRLIAVIGSGGMGKVYKAHDTLMDRNVAIKVLAPEMARQPGYAQRFRREASIAARLTEPHIIPIHEAGEIDGRLYLVMPIIEGTDVHTLLQREGPMSPHRVVAVTEQLAAALGAAHAAGLVHRDIKPSNALVTRNDFVYLIDFGIAHDAKATRLTSTGMMVGTLAYMAPERFTTGTGDARADVYALACVLYECLTGATPFPGGSMERQIAGHLPSGWARWPPLRPLRLRPTRAASSAAPTAVTAPCTGRAPTPVRPTSTGTEPHRQAPVVVREGDRHRRRRLSDGPNSMKSLAPSGCGIGGRPPGETFPQCLAFLRT
jgi:serine/threonine protein kinase